LLSRPSGVHEPASSNFSRSSRGISPKIFRQTLRALERDGLVKREIFPAIPPRVENSLTELVDPIARDWGRGSHGAGDHCPRDVRRIQPCFDSYIEPNRTPYRNPSGDEAARMLESHVCKASMTAIS